MRNALRVALTLAALLVATSASAFNDPASRFRRVAFANLGVPLAGSVYYCLDCTEAAPCAGGGSGAFAYRNGAAWNCGNGSGGTGDVVGPASSTDNAIARFHLATGKIIQNSVVTITDVGAISTSGNSVSFNDQTTGDALQYVAGTGPRFFDGSTTVELTFNVQSLSANRIVTWPNAAGTVTLGGNTFAGTGDVHRTTGTKGTCTLDGGATATCTATVLSGCTPVCTYNSASLPRSISCAVSGTTLTAVSSTTLDSGVVNWHCY